MRPSGDRSMEIWAWLLQRVTGVALFPLLAFHILLTHYSGEPVLYWGVLARLRTPPLFLVDAALLGLGLYHGLNGAYLAAQDMGISTTSERFLAWTLLAVGVTAFAVGLTGLVALR